MIFKELPALQGIASIKIILHIIHSRMIYPVAYTHFLFP